MYAHTARFTRRAVNPALGQVLGRVPYIQCWISPYTTARERERGEGGRGSTLLHTSSRPFSLPSLPCPPFVLPAVAMCVRVSCQGSDPRINILVLFEERELLGLCGTRVVPVTHTKTDRSILRRVRNVTDPASRRKYRRYSFSFRFVT